MNKCNYKKCKTDGCSQERLLGLNPCDDSKFTQLDYIVGFLAISLIAMPLIIIYVLFR